MSLNGDLYACPAFVRPTLKLVDILSQSGEVMSSFGDGLDFDHDLAALNDCHIAVNDSFVYLAFLFFPIVRQYSFEGELINEFKLAHDEMENYEELNKSAYEQSKRGQREGYRPVISNIFASKNGFYLLHIGRVIEILEFDNSGKSVASFWCVKPDKYSANDFSINSNVSYESFYLLQFFPENMINVFGVKN